MSFTSTDLAKIEAAILSLLSGEMPESITFANGHQIQYGKATISGLRKVRAEIQTELGLTHRRVYASNKGRYSL